MPWSTTKGLRTLHGAEAKLVRGAIGMMVDTLVCELTNESEAWQYGIDWFDQWDAGQRLWLLEQVTHCMLGHGRIDSPAAMFDATADAIFFEVIDQIEMEIEQSRAADPVPSWRESVLAAARQQNGALGHIDSNDSSESMWFKLVTTIADEVLGIRLYQRAESFRDLPFQQTEKFLRSRGLPRDYLRRIPPLRSIDRVQLSIDRIQQAVFY